MIINPAQSPLQLSIEAEDSIYTFENTSENRKFLLTMCELCLIDMPNPVSYQLLQIGEIHFNMKKYRDTPCARNVIAQIQVNYPEVSFSYEQALDYLQRYLESEDSHLVPESRAKAMRLISILKNILRQT